MKMFKVQKKRMTAKRKDVQKTREKPPVKTRKIEGNGITSNRLSIPPEFFRAGTSATGSHNKSSGTEKNENCIVDNFNGLFNKCLGIRRSERLQKRSTNRNLIENKGVIVTRLQKNLKNISGTSNASGLRPNCDEDFHGVFKRLKLNSYENTNITSRKFIPLTTNFTSDFNTTEENTSRNILKRSKSIFEEINQLYSQKEKNKLIPKISSNCNSNFCNILAGQINKNFVFGQKIFLVCKSKIFAEIKKVEDILSGKRKMEPKYPSKQRVYFHPPEEDDSDLNWEYFGRSEWVFQTPPTQKIIPHRVEDNQLQPAVICTSKKNTQLFELKPNYKVNLNNFEERKDIPVNDNYLNCIATTNHNMTMDVDREACTSKSAFVNYTNSQNIVCDNTFTFCQPDSRDDIMKVFARPTKTVAKTYPKGPQAKRKLEETLSQEMFCRKSPEKFCDSRKKVYLPNEFKLNFNLEQSRPGYSQVDNDFCFMEADQVEGSSLGFNFKDGAQKHSAFQFPINTDD